MLKWVGEVWGGPDSAQPQIASSKVFINYKNAVKVEEKHHREQVTKASIINKLCQRREPYDVMHQGYMIL